MGAWSTSINGNDTAEDLKQEYTVAFWKFEVPEALRLLDEYVRQDFDESDPEEWVNYYYSLADFMWKKGILTDEVRDKAIAMIDSGFGLDLWEEAGEKTLQSRKKVLAEFREKLLSPQPPKKKIKPDIHAERIFNDGDIIAIELQTAGKPYTKSTTRAMTEDAFHACDGKFVLMQLVKCKPDWHSALVPEVGDYWATFRLFDGVYDEPPKAVDVRTLKPAEFILNGKFTPYLFCESSMYYFKRRHAQIIGNDVSSVKDLDPDYNSKAGVFFGINRPWGNPDSNLLAAMGKEAACGEYTGTGWDAKTIVHTAFSRVSLDHEYNEQKSREISERVLSVEKRGGKALEIRYGGVTVGIMSQAGKCLDDLYIHWDYQNKGFGTRLLQYGLDLAGHGAYMNVPADHAAMLHICEKLGCTAKDSTREGFVRCVWEDNPKKVTNNRQQKNVVYELVMHDPELSGENYTEDFMIGIFRTRTMAEETAAHYLRHVRGFCEYPCTYIITEKEIMDAQDEIPDEVFMVHGWDMNENMDEIDIVESSCFVSEAHANAELDRMKIVQPRDEWIINRWRIDETHWQEGFERV